LASARIQEDHVPVLATINGFAKEGLTWSPFRAHSLQTSY